MIMRAIDLRCSSLYADQFIQLYGEGIVTAVHIITTKYKYYLSFNNMKKICFSDNCYNIMFLLKVTYVGK